MSTDSLVGPAPVATVDASTKVARRGFKTKSELSNMNFPINQKPTMKMPPIHEPVTREPDIIVAEHSIEKLNLDALAMAEEAVEILIHRSVEKFSPPVTDYIAINGVPAEMLFKNGWVRMGYLPRGRSIVTKRKYVEVLARAKHDAINTTVIERDNEDPQNFVERVTTSTMSFTVLQDKNPKAHDWLEQLVRTRS